MSKQTKVDQQNLMAKTPVEVVQDFFNVGKVKRLFRVGTEIVGAVSPFIEKRTPLSALHAAFNVGRVIVDDLEVWPDDYFSEDWTCPYPSDFNRIILNALAGKPYQVIKTSDESLNVHMIHVEGVRFGYILNTKTDFIDRIYVEAESVAKAKAIVKRELWRVMKDDNIVLRHVKRQNSNGPDNEQVALDVDDAFRPMPSKRSVEYAAYLKRCIDAGVPRAVLFYGPPGTGKSTMARTVVDNLKMKSFRIRVEDIGHIDTSSVFEAINIFEPDAVILDDFDRSGDQTSLLETLEFFQRHVKLVIATVNHKNRLDDAILRPGRFDELVQIKQMDEDVVKVVLGDEHQDAFELLKDWPIAYIQEYVKRRRFMTPEEAEESVKELAARVKKLAKYDDEDEEDAIVDNVLKDSQSRKKSKADALADLLLNTSGKKKRK